MSNKIILKKSSVGAKIPLTTDLDYGELALNYADGKLYYKTSGNTIDSFNSATSTGVTELHATSPIVVSQSTGNITLSHATSGVTAGTYGTASAVPVIEVDDKGHITSLTTTAVAGLSGVSYNSSTGVLTLSTSSGTTYTPDLGIGTSDSPTFAGLTVPSINVKTGSTNIANQTVAQASVSSTTQTSIDTFAITTYRSAKYVVQITQGTDYQVSEIMVIHNGTTTTMTEYGMMNTNGVLGTFATDISSANARLLVTMASATSATINISRTTIVV